MIAALATLRVGKRFPGRGIRRRGRIPAVELSSGNDKIKRMFAEKIQRVGLELVIDSVGDAGWADEMQRSRPMQTDT